MKLLRVDKTCEKLGDKRTQLYHKVKVGLVTRPVPLGGGGRAKAWPDFELEEINRARVAGKSDDEVRALVEQLHAQRAQLARDAESSPRQAAQAQASA